MTLIYFGIYILLFLSLLPWQIKLYVSITSHLYLVWSKLLLDLLSVLFLTISYCFVSHYQDINDVLFFRENIRGSSVAGAPCRSYLVKDLSQPDSRRILSILSLVMLIILNTFPLCCCSGPFVRKCRLYHLWRHHIHSRSCQSSTAGDVEQTNGGNCRRNRFRAWLTLISCSMLTCNCRL